MSALVSSSLGQAQFLPNPPESISCNHSFQDLRSHRCRARANGERSLPDCDTASFVPQGVRRDMRLVYRCPQQHASYSLLPSCHLSLLRMLLRFGKDICGWKLDVLKFPSSRSHRPPSLFPSYGWHRASLFSFFYLSLLLFSLFQRPSAIGRRPWIDYLSPSSFSSRIEALLSLPLMHVSPSLCSLSPPSPISLFLPLHRWISSLSTVDWPSPPPSLSSLCSNTLQWLDRGSG